MNQETLLSLPIEQKVGQLFIIGLPGPNLEGDAAALIREVHPGGVCLFARNIREAKQTRDLLDAIRQTLPVEPILCVDQEGGLVDRLRRLVTPMPAAADIETPAQAAKLGDIIAETLRILGFNLDFAPVVDVGTPERSAAENGIYSRTFGSSPGEVVDLAASFLSALQDGGCLGCLKHFPGLGAAVVDSHEELPAVAVTPDEFSQTDLYPYREMLSATGAVMVAHAAYPNVDLQERDQNGKLLPSSLSYAFVTQLLRMEMGFNGVSITDDLEMGAILKNYGISEACRMAVFAGHDLLAICADPARIREGYNAVLGAVRHGNISEDRLDESLIRIADFKSRFRPALEFDLTRLVALSTEIDRLKEHLN